MAKCVKVAINVRFTVRTVQAINLIQPANSSYFQVFKRPLMKRKSSVRSIGLHCAKHTV